MAKVEKGDMRFTLLLLKTENKLTREIILKEGLTRAEAEQMQRQIISENKKAFEELTAEYRQVEEGVDSAEKRGALKAIQNKLAELKYPSATTSFAIQRDRVAERKAAAAELEASRNPRKAGA